MFYIIKEAAGTKETGSAYPQAQDMVPPYDYDAPNSIHMVSYFKGTEIPFEPNFNTIKLMASAKLTDVLSVAMLGGSGLFVSEKLKNILHEHELVGHKFYPVKISQKGKSIEKYFWMHLISDLRDYVDYQKSKFYSRIAGFPDNDNLSFKCKEETLRFYEKIDKHETLRSEYVVFLSNYKLNYDLFYISHFDKNIYISEKLKKTLDENNITGLKILPSNSLVV